MEKEILLVAATHGNEIIGIEVIEKLTHLGLSQYFDSLIANPRALEKSKMYIDVNMNRIYPGKQDSELYEERKAYENLRIAKEYKYVIDLHEASSGTDDFIIVPREKIGDKFPLELINMERVLLWPDPKGPMGDVLENAIEFEFGMKNRSREEAIEKATSIITDFIKNISTQNKRVYDKQIFLVYGKLMQNEFVGDMNNLKDFSETENNGERFLPLLTGQYLYDDIVCYKMKRI